MSHGWSVILKYGWHDILSECGWLHAGAIQRSSVTIIWWMNLHNVIHQSAIIYILIKSKPMDMLTI